MAQPRMKPGTRRLSEVARHLVLPDGIVSTAWPAVREKCRELGITFDPWQDGLGRAALGKRADGKYAAGVGGVVVSIPRQVGKTYLVGAIAFALCLLYPGLTVVWTAHRMKTAAETFQVMQGMARRRRIAPYIKQIYTGAEDRSVIFTNGSRILFGARERGFGRGFAEVDVEVFDEAQILGERALDDMIPATNASRFPAGALLFFIGTPPRPDDPAESFRGKRSRALSGKTRDMLYVEMGADPDAQIGDWNQVERANPSYPLRTPREAILRMQENLDEDSYRREGLGIWDEDSDTGIFGPSWGQTFVPVVAFPGRPRALALAASFDLSHACLAAGSVGDDGRLWGKPLDHRPGTEWVVRRAAKRTRRLGLGVVIDKRGPAGQFVPALEDAGVEVLEVDTSFVLDSAAGLYTAVTTGRFVHGPAPELDTAARSARWRDVGDRRAFGRKGSGDVSPLEAVSLAVRAAEFPLDSQLSIFTSADLDLCDNCGVRPHEDPDGEHDYLCAECREGS